MMAFIIGIYRMEIAHQSKNKRERIDRNREKNGRHYGFGNIMFWPNSCARIRLNRKIW